MYCKHCGKIIADDSTFCQYCGGRMDIPKYENSISDKKDESSRVSEGLRSSQQSPQRVIVSTEKAAPIQIELSKKTKSHSSVIANEIIANLKMIGIAIILDAIFLIGFTIYHSDDFKQMAETTKNIITGCYDDPNFRIEEKWVIRWDYEYYNTLLRKNRERERQRGFYLYLGNPRDTELQSFVTISDFNYSKIPEYIKEFEQSLNLTQDEIEELKKEAIEHSDAERRRLIQKLNEHRKTAFLYDLEYYALIVGLICLAIAILGRYLIKAIQWVGKNKTV